MENVLSLLGRNVSNGEILWLNVLNVKEKLVLLRRLGRWLEGKIRVAREQNLQLDSLNAAENLSGPC
jgi:hypothetical protein